MFLKNVSLVPVRITTPGGSVIIAPNHWESVDLHYCNNPKLIEVDAEGNLKSGVKALVTENDKRTVAADLNVTAAPLVEDKAEVAPVQAPVEPPAAPTAQAEAPIASESFGMMTTEHVFKPSQRAGRPKKL